jgi:hypothetical protein
LLIWLALSAATTMLTALAALLAALARLMLSALTWVLRLLARLVLSAALLLAGLLLATLLMLGIVGVLRHGSSPLEPSPGNLFSFQLWPSCGRNVENRQPAYSADFKNHTLL